MDSGFGYALIPSIYTMPDPNHKVIAWRGHTKATYGFYHRVGTSDGIIPLFVKVAQEIYARPEYAQSPCEVWQL